MFNLVSVLKKVFLFSWITFDLPMSRDNVYMEAELKFQNTVKTLPNDNNIACHYLQDKLCLFCQPFQKLGASSPSQKIYMHQILICQIFYVVMPFANHYKPLSILWSQTVRHVTFCDQKKSTTLKLSLIHL